MADYYINPELVFPQPGKSYTNEEILENGIEIQLNFSENLPSGMIPYHYHVGFYIYKKQDENNTKLYGKYTCNANGKDNDSIIDFSNGIKYNKKFNSIIYDIASEGVSFENDQTYYIGLEYSGNTHIEFKSEYGNERRDYKVNNFGVEDDDQYSNILVFNPNSSFTISENPQEDNKDVNLGDFLNPVIPDDENKDETTDNENSEENKDETTNGNQNSNQETTNGNQNSNQENNNSTTPKPSGNKSLSDVNIQNIINKIKTETETDLKNIYKEFLTNLKNTNRSIDNYYKQCPDDVRLSSFLDKGEFHIEDLDTLRDILYEKAISRLKCIEQDLKETEVLDEVGLVDAIFTAQEDAYKSQVEAVIKDYNDRVLLVESMGRKC